MEDQRWLKSQSNYSLEPADLAEALYQCVAETAVTTMMAQNSIECNRNGVWAVTCTFQEIYEDHFTAQDDLAEIKR